MARRSHWADVSDEDSWDEAVVEEPKPEEKTPVTVSEPRKPPALLLNQLQSFTPPVSFRLDNLKFSIENTDVLYEFFGLTPDDCKIELIYRNNRPSGSASLIANSMELAAKIVEFHGKILQTRPLTISIDHPRQGRRPWRGKQGGFFNDRGKMNNSRRNIGPAQKANPFGDARPVDTTKKELEFDKKIQEPSKEDRKEEVKKEETKEEAKTEPVRARRAWDDYEATLAILMGPASTQNSSSQVTSSRNTNTHNSPSSSTQTYPRNPRKPFRGRRPNRRRGT